MEVEGRFRLEAVVGQSSSRPNLWHAVGYVHEGLQTDVVEEVHAGDAFATRDEATAAGISSAREIARRLGQSDPSDPASRGESAIEIIDGVEVLISTAQEGQVWIATARFIHPTRNVPDEVHTLANHAVEEDARRTVRLLAKHHLYRPGSFDRTQDDGAG